MRSQEQEFSRALVQAPEEEGPPGIDKDSNGNFARDAKKFQSWIKDGEVAGIRQDRDALKWLNYFLEAIWPYVTKSLERLLREQVEPQIKEAAPSPFKGIHFTSLDFGTAYPKLGPVHIYQKTRQSHHGIELDVDLEWNCDSDIVLQLAPGITVGIKQLHIKGQVSLVFRPLMDSMPILGGMQVTMISPPTITWDFKGLGQIIDFSVISDIVRNVVMDLIVDQLVLPNRIFIHWVQGREREINITAMQFPIPEGVLRLGVIEARGLDAKDWHLFSKASSDPFANIRIGARSHRTSVKKNNLNPVWGDDGWYDFFIFNPKQLVRIEVYDKDTMPGGDDYIGMVSDDLTIQYLLKHPDVWIDIYSDPKKKDHRSGEIRVVSQALTLNSLKHSIKHPPESRGLANSKALLNIEVRCLRGLPTESSTGAIMNVQVGKQTFKTKPSEFNEAVQDFVYDPTTQVIDPAAQRMAEYMATEGNVSVEQISQLSGLDLKSLEKILRERPSFFAKWNHAFNVLVDDMSAGISLSLLPAGGDPRECAVSSVDTCPALDLSTLMKEENMTWEGIMHLDYPPTLNLPKDAPAGPFALDAKISLLGLS